MFKRVTIVALVVAAFVLVMAVPAMAFNGLRGDYTTTNACAVCHSGSPGIPSVYPDWAKTGHAKGAVSLTNRSPYGSSCAGCHASNYDPNKAVPMATATEAATGVVTWAWTNTAATAAQTVGNAATSESNVGCSACHYGANVTGSLAVDGVDPNDTAHMAPMANLASAEICGQCHSRYSYTVATSPVQPIPYLAVTLPVPPGTPTIPNPTPTSLLQPQYAMGYQMLGAPTTWTPAALSTVLTIPKPGWTPAPVATPASGVQSFWQIDVSTDPNVVKMQDTVWQYRGHDGSASQYPEWANEGHANALTGLTSQSFWAFLDEPSKQECLECHSTDFRLLKEAGKNPTSANAKYGITCVGCHTPHDKGTATGAWSEEWQPQLRTDDAQTLCVECHNGEIPEGTTATPGAEIHHPMKEMMDGYGAIGVASFPSVHKGKCVQCHMPPTSTSPTGANHTFKIIEPEVAAEAKPNPAQVTDTATMPYSACTTCHSRPADTPATWLQDTITQRQSWTKAKIAQIWDELKAGAVKLGYADAQTARDALVAIPEAQWTSTERLFLSAFTNVEFVESEGSFGLHNWDYSREIVNTAHVQALTVADATARTWVVSLRVSKDSIKKGQKIFFRGVVQTGWGFAGKGKVTLQRRMNGQQWRNWKTQTLKTNGTYDIQKRLNFKKGKWFFRTRMPGDGGLNLTAVSPNRVIRIK
jgi:nitrate/TMAO reductase-like tetraheme cytochrome c subunit